ncbi:unnamed protein product [Spodoptera exigua]|nr:unnamed protein product [Spodoptera exigua]
MKYLMVTLFALLALVAYSSAGVDLVKNALCDTDEHCKPGCNCQQALDSLIKVCVCGGQGCIFFMGQALCSLPKPLQLLCTRIYSRYNHENTGTLKSGASQGHE